MAVVVPFRWQGATRTGQLRLLLAARAQEWLRGWACTPGSLECSIEAVEGVGAGPLRAGERWYVQPLPQGATSVRLPPRAFERLGCLLAGISSADDQGLAAAIGRRAFLDASRVLFGAGDDASEAAGAPAAQAVDPRCGVAGYRWCLGGIDMALYLDAGACEGLMPGNGTAGGGLVSRKDAMGAGTVTLPAFLELGSTSLERTLALRPGDVIKTGAAIGSLVRVKSESGAVVFSGELVADDGHRGVRCVSAPTA